MTATRVFGMVLTAAVTLLWAGLATTLRAEPNEKHIHIHHALYELKEAKTELKEASHDFGGHRKEALEAVEAAIVQLDKALAGADDKFTVIKVEKDVYKKYEHHPHIQRAINELKEARVQLKEAKHNFGGHREKALKDLEYAIDQLEICMKFHKGS